MAKGITNQPLMVHVAHEWYARVEILALMRQGHQVHDMNKVTSGTADLIIHPAAGWTEDLFDYIPAALMRARARRKAK